MKLTFWTTTEYLHNIQASKNENVIDTGAGRWAMFSSRKAAEYDAQWLRDYCAKDSRCHDRGLAKKCGGPKIVKVILKVVRK